MELRAAILAVTDQFGWRLPGQDWFGGLINPAVTAAIPDEEVGVWGTVVPCYRDVQRLEEVYRSPHKQISAANLQAGSYAVWLERCVLVIQMCASVEAGHDRLLHNVGVDAEPIPELEFDQTLGW